MVKEHPIDEVFYGASSTALNEIISCDQRSKTSSNVRDEYLSATAVPSNVRRASESAASGDNRQSQDHNALRAPKSPTTVLKYYIQFLSHYEQKEVRKYEHIYFMGPHAKKIKGTPDNPILNHGYDDDRGDYHLVMQDHLAYRYEVLEALGAGSFGQVVKCFDHKTGHTVAIKLIRNKKRFHAQAMTEVKILKNLVDWDPEDRFHNIRMTDYFYFRNHLCVAFECLSMNLYEFIKSNNFQGFSLGLIRRFTIQILQSLCLLYEHRVIHCDLKPENILLKHPGKSSIKVIDFGSSCVESERVYTYIQSRFYRAPEVILGMTYGMPIDMWSLGCILAELYTGVPIFPGESEQEQLACIMEVIGVPDRYLIERSSRRRLFFDSSCSPRVIPNSRGKKRRPGTKSIPQALRCHDRLFVDFIQKCLQWDPDRRLRPHEALRHEWIAQSGSIPQSSSSSTTISHRPKYHSTPKMTSG
ncbi:kinase-like domain-containing protein [Fennellomyces sp. T-0311]|nr:kinase-like domain-containing protein [Fennellomyces sp. T-0311]